ncbi:uncharacterized protein LOC143039279 isoform X2 [Oratosquilla oratoria]
MRISKTHPNVGKYLLFKSIYRCQHNTRQNDEKVNMKASSKNTNCPAQVILTIKRTTGFVKKKQQSIDVHLPTHPTTVSIRFLHNHPLRSAEVLKRRDVAPEVKAKFVRLYEAGHTPTSAIKIHKYDLQMEEGENYSISINDRRKCPDVSWCFRLYYKMIGKNNSGKACQDYQSREVLKAMLKAFTTTLCEKLDSNPSAFYGPVSTFLKSYGNLRTQEALIAALKCFGKCSSVVGERGKKRPIVCTTNKVEEVVIQPNISNFDTNGSPKGRRKSRIGKPPKKLKFDEEEKVEPLNNYVPSVPPPHPVPGQPEVQPHHPIVCLPQNIQPPPALHINNFGVPPHPQHISHYNIGTCVQQNVQSSAVLTNPNIIPEYSEYMM